MGLISGVGVSVSRAFPLAALLLCSLCATACTRWGFDGARADANVVFDGGGDRGGATDLSHHDANADGDVGNPDVGHDGVGEDQLIVVDAPPAPSRAIYRSVGPGSTAPLVSGDAGGTLHVSGGTVLFTGTSIPSSVGVGDLVQYDADNDGTFDTIAFIHRRLAADRFDLRLADGALPADMPDPSGGWSICRAYLELRDALNGDENVACIHPDLAAQENFDAFAATPPDLVATDKQWFIALYNDGTDGETADDVLWTTDAQHCLTLFTPSASSEVGSSQRHGGMWDDGAYQLAVGWGWNPAIRSTTGCLRVDGLQIQHTGAHEQGPSGIRYSGGGQLHVSNCLIRASGTGVGLDVHSVGINLDSVQSGARVHLWNNIIIGWASGVLYDWGQAIHGAVYNNTLVDNYVAGLLLIGGAAENNLHVKNNLVQGSTDHALWLADVKSNINNLTDNDEAPDASLRNQVVAFRNAGVLDYRLAATDSAARDRGLDLSADAEHSFSKGIDGTSRPQGPAWDIGADEVQ